MHFLTVAVSSGITPFYYFLSYGAFLPLFDRTTQARTEKEGQRKRGRRTAKDHRLVPNMDHCGRDAIKSSQAPHVRKRCRLDV